MTLPPDPIQQQPTYDGALAAFEQLPPIRVLFDNGAGGRIPGQPYPGFEQSFASFPSRAPRPAPGTWRPGVLADAPPAARPRRRLHLGRARAAADRLHRRHGRGLRRPVDRDAALPVVADTPRGR